jgi:hypothetical protein
MCHGGSVALSHIGPGHSSSRSASTGLITDRRRPTLALGARCAFRRRRRMRQAAAGIRPLWPAQDGRITARSHWVFAAPPMIQSVFASRSVLGGRFASTGVEDAALSSEPTVALRASVRHTEASSTQLGASVDVTDARKPTVNGSRSPGKQATVTRTEPGCVKRGGGGGKTDPPGGMHRQGPGLGPAPAGTDPPLRRDDPGSGRDPRSHQGPVGFTSVRLRCDPDSPERRRRSDP